jgi:hypothetical protein
MRREMIAVISLAAALGMTGCDRRKPVVADSGFWDSMPGPAGAVSPAGSTAPSSGAPGPTGATLSSGGEVSGDRAAESTMSPKSDSSSNSPREAAAQGAMKSKEKVAPPPR